jgi:23S rRNA pseudouridine2605 synthase
MGKVPNKTPDPEGPQLRIQKYLSRAGLASRREAEKLILQGRVQVNGQVVRTLGSKIVPGKDRVELDGNPVEEAALRWVLLYKPSGAVTTRKDPQGRPTVYGLLPKELRDLRYVGRLDQTTEGLLLLTNEGGTLHRLTHPSYEVEREYEAWLHGAPRWKDLQRLESGVQLEDGEARATAVRVLSKTRGGTVISLVLREGRKREVRRMLEAVGFPVLRLRRVRFGPIRLGTLEAGAWRELEANEIRALRRAVRMEEGS